MWINRTPFLSANSFHVGQEVEWNEEYFTEYHGSVAVGMTQIEKCKIFYGSPLIIQKIFDNEPFLCVNKSERPIGFCWIRPIKQKTGFFLGELE